MICPNCQNQCAEYDIFCFRCGARLNESQTPRQGRHLVPLLLLAVLSVVGICLFFLMPMTDSPAATRPESTSVSWFSVENGILRFDPEKYTGGSELTIPEVVNGQTVTQLASGCFSGCDSLTTVILPDSLRIIGMNAFEGCTSLRGIFIPEGVHTIGQKAFSGCESLEAVTIPSSVTSIGSGAFDNCKVLYHIFYNGEVSTWRSLYDGKITLRTQVYCTDGNHLHR